MNQQIFNKHFTYIEGTLVWKLPRTNRVKVGSRAGYVVTGGYRQIHLMGTNYQEHRVIWIMHYGDIPEDLTVDHKDRNKLNNYVDNLRLATATEQTCNSSICKRNSTGVKGVNFNKQHQKYVARVMLNGKSKYLGLFDTVESAAKAVVTARNELHGNFACDG